MKTITLTLTNSQIEAIRNDKTVFAKLINNGQCCEMLDMGLSVIDLHGLYVQLVKALDKANEA